jgi:hypothetical protein
VTSSQVNQTLNEHEMMSLSPTGGRGPGNLPGLQPRWKLSAAVFGVIMALGLVGCSAQGKSSSGSAVRAGASSWTLPARADPGARDAINALFTGESALGAAEEEMIRRCMAAKGMRYTKNPAQTTDNNIVLPPIGKLYGLTIEQARRSGYGMRAKVAQGRPQEFDQTAGLTEQQKQAWGVAFGGPEGGSEVSIELPGDTGIVKVPSEGCVSAARIQVYGSLMKYMQRENVAADITMTAMHRSDSDPAMARIDSAWAACMPTKGISGSIKGHSAARPTDAQGLAINNYGRLVTDVAFRKEVAIAVADAECEQQTGYIAQRTELEDRYFTAALRIFEPQVAAIREITKESLVRARTALAGGQ